MKKRLYIPPGAPGHPRIGPSPGSKRTSEGPRQRPPKAPQEGRKPREDERSSLRRVGPGPIRPQAPRLVYQDDTILAFDKPVGMTVIPPEGSRARCLLDLATEAVARRKPKGRAAVVHRIDRDTSGIVVFAADGKTKKLLMEGWDELVTKRLYVALVAGKMAEASGVFDYWLKENKGGEVYRALPREKGAKRAVTKWRVIGESDSLSLLELELETGRKHQIRVQLADSGHPVIGDERYGSGRGSGLDLGRLCLHAQAIELKLPGRESLLIESPPPPEFAAALRLKS
jgi:23S rRNA pseudouridine1911/1915/1917 synthase